MGPILYPLLYPLFRPNFVHPRLGSPTLTAARTQALTTLEDVSALLSLHMIHAPRNTPVPGQRARTAYTDHAPPLPRRHLLRLWIATPESEGGWKLPFRDSADARRGGVQIGGQSSVVVLDAE